MPQEKEKEQKGKDETKRDELSDADLDKASGGLITETNLPNLKPKIGSFGGEDWERK